jgi:hypothetical protein
MPFNSPWLTKPENSRSVSADGYKAVASEASPGSFDLVYLQMLISKMLIKRQKERPEAQKAMQLLILRGREVGVEDLRATGRTSTLARRG